MILSNVNANVELVVSVGVADLTGRELDIEFLIDTGFTGDLALPPMVISAFGLPFVTYIVTRLADGTTRYEPLYRAVILWDGAPRIVQVIASAGGLPLLGMGLLRNHDLHARVRPGGEIRIEKIP
jgi:clan AA aspartic protease